MAKHEARDAGDLLEILKAELEFIEKGGYGRSVRTPWKATSIFEDSLSCINFGDAVRHRPCSECLLIDFVSPSGLYTNVPCHHIPLNPAGETIETLEQRGDNQRLQETVKEWLKTNIERIERQQATSDSTVH